MKKEWLKKYEEGGDVQPKILQDFEKFRTSSEGKEYFKMMNDNQRAKQISGRIDYSEIDPITDVLLGAGIGKGLMKGITKSPMWYDKLHLGNLKNVIPSEGGELIERGVSSEKAIQDFFNTGIIRNNKSAGLATKNDERFGERVFWGSENKGNIPRNNYTIIAKNNPELLNRPATYEDVQDILIKNQEGYSSYPNWKDNIKKPKLAKGGTINPYEEMTNYSPIPQKENNIYNIIHSPMQAYSFNKSMEDLNDNTPPTGENLIKLKDNRTIDQATGNKINPNNRFNYNVHKDTIKEIIENATERGIDPQTALAMTLQESGMSRMNYLNDRNAGLQGMELTETEKLNNDGNQEIRKIAEKYPSGVSRKQWNASSFDTIKKQFDYAKKLGKTNEADVIQSFNGYGKVKDMYGIPGENDMSKNPLYGKRVIDFRENIIKKNPEIIDMLNTYSKKMENGGELEKLDQISNFTNYNKPTVGGWLSKY